MNASKYHIFCRVVDLGSFTKAADELGYTQSAVSQIIKALEADLGAILLERRRDGIRLTSDGLQYLPFLRSLSGAELALQQKQKEMDGLESSTILIDTFTSVSRNILPPMMRAFREQYPGVQFVLRQGDYASIHDDLIAGRVDLGFISTGSAAGTEGLGGNAPGGSGQRPARAEGRSGETGFVDLEMVKLYDDDMVAALPPGHPLAAQYAGKASDDAGRSGDARITLQDLSHEPLILLDEGAQYNTVLDGFRRLGLTPHIDYEVYDDYSIISMIRQGLGVSILFRRVVHGFSDGVEIRELSPVLTRPVYLAWKNWDTLPLSARRFAEYILDHAKFFAESPKNT